MDNWPDTFQLVCIASEQVTRCQCGDCNALREAVRTGNVARERELRAELELSRNARATVRP